MYDPMIGRWLQEDPIGFAGGDINIYRYVKNSPTNYTDPSGLRVYGAERAINDLRTWLNDGSGALRRLPGFGELNLGFSLPEPRREAEGMWSLAATDEAAVRRLLGRVQQLRPGNAALVAAVAGLMPQAVHGSFSVQVHWRPDRGSDEDLNSAQFNGRWWQFAWDFFNPNPGPDPFAEVRRALNGSGPPLNETGVNRPASSMTGPPAAPLRVDRPTAPTLGYQPGERPAPTVHDLVKAEIQRRLRLGMPLPARIAPIHNDTQIDAWHNGVHWQDLLYSEVAREMGLADLPVTNALAPQSMREGAQGGYGEQLLHSAMGLSGPGMPGVRSGNGRTSILARRVTNPKHHRNSQSPEPTNVQQLFDNSIADSTGVRWAKDSNGVIHRFSRPVNDESHWNGSTVGPRPIRMNNIPIEIRGALE